MRNPVVRRNPVVPEIPYLVPGCSTATYYNIPILVPRNSRCGSQSEQPTHSSPPIPMRQSKPLVVRSCPPSASIPHSSKNTANHSYYMFSVPTAGTTVNHVTTGHSLEFNTVPRYGSLNNVGPSRNENVSSNFNNSDNCGNNRDVGGGRSWRRYSVGDILHKLQEAVSGGFSFPRGLVRSISRLSVSPPASSSTTVSPDLSTSDRRFFTSGLKRRSASEILHPSPPQPPPRTPPVDGDGVTTKSYPEKDFPPVPPPRPVMRTKPAAKTKVLRSVFIKTRLLSE